VTLFTYAAFVGLTLDLLAPLIYGPHYAVPQTWRVFITLTVFLATYRGAHTALLLTQRRTGKLAIANATVGLGVLAAALAVRMYPTPEAILAGKLFGDTISIAVFDWAVFSSLKSSWRTVLQCLIFSLCSVGLFGIMISSLPNPAWSTRISLSAVCIVPLSLLLWRVHISWKTRKLAFSGEAARIPVRALCSRGPWHPSPRRAVCGAFRPLRMICSCTRAPQALRILMFAHFDVLNQRPVAKMR